MCCQFILSGIYFNMHPFLVILCYKCHLLLIVSFINSSAFLIKYLILSIIAYIFYTFIRCQSLNFSYLLYSFYSFTCLPYISSDPTYSMFFIDSFVCHISRVIIYSLLPLNSPFSWSELFLCILSFMNSSALDTHQLFLLSVYRSLTYLLFATRWVGARGGISSCVSSIFLN